MQNPFKGECGFSQDVSSTLQLLVSLFTVILCKDLQAIGALKKHLEKNHILQSVVSFSILWQKWHLTCWILGFCVNKLSFFIIWQNCPLPEVIFVTPVTADGSVKFLPELCKFLQKQHIQHNLHKKLSLLICLCFFLSKLLNKFMSNQKCPNYWYL